MFAIRYLVNQVVLGVVLNVLALGLTNFGYHVAHGRRLELVQQRGSRSTPIKIPLLGDIPVIGQALFDVNIIVYLTYALVVVVDVGAVPHPLGPAHPRGRRAPEGRRHGRHQGARAPATATCSSAV